jgi:hypothetical protein
VDEPQRDEDRKLLPKSESMPSPLCRKGELVSR